jgi:hypothetical protein
MDTTSRRLKPELHYWTPGTSTWIIEASEYLTHSNVCCVPLSHVLYLYHPRRAQGLCPQDYNVKVEFYQWFLQKFASSSLCFLSLVLFREDTGFRGNVIAKFQSTADVDPGGSISSPSQEQFAINVWLDMIGDTLARPSVSRQKLSKAWWYSNLL